jgi:hypothetical protein
MFYSVLKYESKGKSSTYMDFQFHYISSFNMLHSILGGVYKFESLMIFSYLAKYVANTRSNLDYVLCIEVTNTLLSLIDWKMLLLRLNWMINLNDNGNR